MVWYAVATHRGPAALGVVHSRLDCPHVARRAVVEVAAGGRVCRVCTARDARDARDAAHPPCLVCGAEEVGDTWRGCEEHILCGECLSAHVAYQLENPRWDRAIRCPCGGAARSALPIALRALVDARAGRPPADAPPPSADPVHRLVERALTPRCPHCDAAFYDFTGCAAVMCRCGGHFCACCLAPQPSSEACHAHVRACRFNPSGDYWIETTRLQRIMHDRRCARAWGMLGQIARETDSLVYAGGVALRVRRVDAAALLPHCLRAVLCVPSLLWWCLLLLVYPYATLAASTLHYAVQYYLCTRPAGRA